MLENGASTATWLVEEVMKGGPMEDHPEMQALPRKKSESKTILADIMPSNWMNQNVSTKRLGWNC